MTRDFLIQLTNSVYRLTLLFPKKEPLRYKIRETADDFLAKPNEKDLEILDSFFEVAKTQQWVKTADILAIQEEYANLRQELDRRKSGKKNNPGELKPQEMRKVGPLSLEARPMPEKPMLERQEKILAFLKENGRAQIWQIKQVFPDVTKRTLRRDFDHLLKEKLVERIGERNDTFYQIRREQV
jgi:Fic family protein